MKHRIALTIVFLLCGADVKAGPYLDLDVGKYIDYYDLDAYNRSNPIGYGPVGMLTIGYEYEELNIKFLHISSLTDSQDTGINILSLGVRIQ